VHPEVVIIYNSLGDLDLWQAVEQSGAVRIYYEHGAAWLTDRRTEVECLLSHSDGIICNSHAARRILELRWGIPQGLAEVLLNPIREGLGSATLEPKILDKGRPLHLGTAGRLISLKGFALAIHAIRHLRDDGIACELHLAGEGPEETRLCALAKNLGLGNEIRFPGRVSDMAAFYRQLDIFLCPSIREPLGNVCIEAGYLGCPVICSAVDGLPEVVLDESTGFCLPPSLPAERYDELGGTASELPKYVYDPKTDSLTEPKLLDPAQIAAKVRFLNDHPDTYTAMSAAAHQHVASRFDIGGYVQGLNRLILQARARSKAAPS
jgi:glycosyltransferase involved in cell wall biosynthesis